MAWHLITQGDDQNSNYMEFLLDNESDINSPPTSIYSYSLSSIAHTPGFTKVWECDANGNWIEVVNSGGGGGGASTAIVAPQYSDLTFPVSKGQHCIYNDGYYEANTNIATPESWTSAHWTQLTIGGEAQALKTAIQGISVTPEMYGAKGDGVTDDSQAVQDAIDAGYNIRFDDNKIYYLASTINIDHDCHLSGGKNTVIKTKTPQGGFANTAFNIHGTLKKTTSLTSNYTTAGESLSNAGDRFQFTDMEDIAIGDIMVIEATDQFYSYARDYYYLGGTLLISDVNDDYVFSCDALPFKIENTENVTVKIYDAPSVKIEGIKFESDGETAGEYIYSVVMRYCKNSEIKDCSITKMDNGLRIHNCVNTLVDCVTVSKMPLSGTGRALDHYGIAIYSSTNTTIQRVMSNAANSSIDLSGTIPNINTRIRMCNLCALSRHDGFGMHENAYNTSFEDCVIGGLQCYGSVIVSRCRFIRSYQQPSQISGISFRGTHRKDCSWLRVNNCVFDSQNIPISITTPYVQDNPQPFNHIIREIIITDCYGGMLAYTAETNAYILSNRIINFKITNWKNVYEFWHTSSALIDSMVVENCEFSAKRWINDHNNVLSTNGIRFLRVKNDYPKEDKVFIDIDKYGDTVHLPKNNTINCVTNTPTDHFVVCGRNIESNDPDDFMVGYANGNVGSALSRYTLNEFNNSLSVNEQGEIVFTQPNTTTKAYIFPVCLAFVRKNRYVKMSCKLKNTGNTSGSQFRAYMAVVSCETGKLTYANNGTTATATAEGAVVTHSREITEDSLVLCYLYCNSPVANAQTTLSEFVAEVQEYDFLKTLVYEEYVGSSRDGEGTLLSVEGINNILVNASGAFNVRTKADFTE